MTTADVKDVFTVLMGQMHMVKVSAFVSGGAWLHQRLEAQQHMLLMSLGQMQMLKSLSL